MKLRKPVASKIAHAETRKAISEWLAHNCPGVAWWRETDEAGTELLDVFTVFILSLRK
jgi:hypothetical protein